MDWKDIAGTVGKAAPILGTLLAGPAGGAAAGLIASALGVKSDPETIAQALADPAAAARLREIETAHRARLRELALQGETARLAAETDRLRIAAADRDSARRAAVDGGQAGRVFALTVVIFVVVVGLEGAALLLGIPTTIDQQLAGRILGTFDAALLAAIYYTFGSSAGSARKDELRGAAK
jgi:hypothetical protein